MGIKIEVGRVAGVLLADGWHQVEVGSFTLGPVEATDGNAVAPIGPGFIFREYDERTGNLSVFAGPFTALQAVRVGT